MSGLPEWVKGHVHMAHVEYAIQLSHGYPYRGTCSCGWISMGYAAPHAAQLMVDAHLEECAR